jgi:hypothetical protein
MPDRIQQEIQEQTFFTAWPGFPTNGTVTIGRFQGMFEHNILTFSSGSDYEAETVEAASRNRRVA